MSTPTPLASLIGDMIATDGPITLERYMEIVLQHPQYGYYRQGNPLGINGDFITSPEAGPMFGEMIGIWCVEVWKRLGKPSPFILLELGPGQGSLLRDALRLTQHIADFNQALRLYLFESSSTLRQIQQEQLAAFHPIHIDDLQKLPSFPAIIIANEFFDTLPIRQFVRSRFGWYERYIACAASGFKFINKFRLRLPKNIQINPNFQKMEPGHVYETSSQASFFMKLISSHIAQRTGAGLVIDYGYLSPPGKGTLDALYQQKFVNIFDLPGKVDVTAGVDFAVLSDIARQEGTVVAKAITQREFLEQMDISSRAEMHRSRADDKQRAGINLSLHYITNHSKMGKFKVLEFAKLPS